MDADAHSDDSGEMRRVIDTGREMSLNVQISPHSRFLTTLKKKLGDQSASSQSTKTRFTFDIDSPSQEDRDVLTLLQATVDDLSCEMKALMLKNQNVRLSSTGPTSSILSLPSEILGEIFTFTLPDMIFPRKTSLSPLGLSHVCSAWRNVALGSSGLWDRLSLDVFRHSRPHILSALISPWFLRANPTRLLVFSLANHISVGRVAEDITLSLIPFLHRFSELRFEKIHSKSLAILLSLSSSRLPMLERLILDCDEGYLDCIPQITLFAVAPRLHTVALGISSHVLGDAQRFPFPWTQLLSLNIQRAISLNDFSKIVFQCLRLRFGSFIISNHPNEFPPFVPPGPVVFSDLRALTVHLDYIFDNFAGLANVLSRFRLPIIHNLTLANKHPINPFPVASILPAWTESLRSVRVLEVFSSLDTEQDFIGLISTCPYLEGLALRTHAGSIETSLLRNLRLGINASASRLALPYLRSFTFHTTPTVGTMESVVEEFILLIQSWIMDMSKIYLLDSVTLVVYDSGNDAEKTREIYAALGDVRQGLRPWIRAADNISRPRRFTLETKVVLL